MNDFVLDIVSNGVHFDVTLSDSVCVFEQDSGTGKTFLFTTIAEYCVVNSLKCVTMNSSRLDLLDSFEGSVKDVDILLLDNADLYLTDELFKRLAKNAKRVLISVKDISRLSLNTAGFYFVRYVGNSLTVVRRTSYV